MLLLLHTVLLLCIVPEDLLVYRDGVWEHERCGTLSERSILVSMVKSALFHLSLHCFYDRFLFFRQVLCLGRFLFFIGRVLIISNLIALSFLLTFSFFIGIQLLHPLFFPLLSPVVEEFQHLTFFLRPASFRLFNL